MSIEVVFAKKENVSTITEIFNHYIFEHDNTDLNHIPEHALDILKMPLDETSARKIRADLLNKLKR